MRKLTSVLALIVLGTFAVSAQQPKYVLKFSNVGAEAEAQSQGMKKFKEVIEQLTNKQITVQLYHNSSLYNQDAATGALRSGELEMTMTSIQLTADYVKKLRHRVIIS